MTNTLKHTRRWILFFMVMLFLSGLTAIPLETELTILCRTFPPDTVAGQWFDKIQLAIAFMNEHHPFMAYGYDWLAFAHFVLAILFIGPLQNPVRNKWVIEFGMIACLLVIPFALIAGHFREIPFAWRFIDCSFGVLGLIPLGIVNANIGRMEHATEDEKTQSSFLPVVSNNVI